jgi:hypothetical protein
MSLEVSRAVTSAMLYSTTRDEMAILANAIQWFKAYKEWEAQETFDRAFTEGRMTARVAQVGEPTQWPTRIMAPVSDPRKKYPVKLASTVDGRPGLRGFLDPNNFLNHRKNDLGLHDLSAVLVKPNASVSAQLFKKDRVVIFMPLPLDADLRLVHQLGVVAKMSKAGPLHQFYVEVRNCMTRLKYGSPEDMHSGLFVRDKGDNKAHVTYGFASIQGNPFSEEYLRQRSMNALNYTKTIAEAATVGGNNEVTVKYRQHAGDFPFIGSRATALPAPIRARIKMDDTDYLIANLKSPDPIGMITDLGKYTKF